MDMLQGMRVFAAVVEAGSFVRAADQLDISKSAVTDHIADLERRLSVRLLHRTTRRLSLTDDGAAYLEHCRRVLADVDETIATLSRGRAVPRGRLRVDAPSAIAMQYLLPALPRFTEQYPEVEVILTLNDYYVDLLAEGVDVALRAGVLRDASIVARRLYESPFVICASPLYLERFGAPRTPEDLGAHQCLPIYSITSGRVLPWIFEHEGVRTEWQPRARLAISNAEAIVTSASAGAGIVYVNTAIVERPLASGALVPVLADYVRRDRMPFSAVYPHNRHLSAKTRAFVDFVASLFPRPRGEAVETNGSGR